MSRFTLGIAAMAGASVGATVGAGASVGATVAGAGASVGIAVAAGARVGAAVAAGALVSRAGDAGVAVASLPQAWIAIKKTIPSPRTISLAILFICLPQRPSLKSRRRVYDYSNTVVRRNGGPTALYGNLGLKSKPHREPDIRQAVGPLSVPEASVCKTLDYNRLGPFLVNLEPVTACVDDDDASGVINLN